MRVTNISRSSEGALAIRKCSNISFRVAPGRFTNVRSEGCRGLRSNADGFRTGTPMWPSALPICSTAGFIASGISWAATMTSLTGVSCVQRSFPNGLIRKKVTPATGWVPQSSRNEAGVEYTVSCAPMPVARCGIRSTSRSYPAEYA
jgi:hypothetical protein